MEKEDLIHWKKVKKGDANAFDWLYHRYVDDLYKYGQNFSQDRHLLEDCIQEIFIALWKKKENGL